MAGAVTMVGALGTSALSAAGPSRPHVLDLLSRRPLYLDSALASCPELAARSDGCTIGRTRRVHARRSA